MPCLLRSGNAGERLRVLKASLLRLTPIENLSVVQDGQALGRLVSTLFSLTNTCCSSTLERNRFRAGLRGQVERLLEVVAMHRSDAIHT